MSASDENNSPRLALALFRAFCESEDRPTGFDPNSAQWWGEAFRSLRAYREFLIYADCQRDLTQDEAEALRVLRGLP